MSQLFRKVPPVEILEEIFGLLGIHNFNQTYKFSRKDIKEKGVIEKLLETDLTEYYSPSKYAYYFDKKKIDEKRVITILRQLLRPYGYKLESKEKYTGGRKHFLYNLIKINSNNDTNTANGITVDFE